MRDKTYVVYILASRSRVLYVGVTNNLELRVFQHKKGTTPGFTKRYYVSKLVYYEIWADIRGAITREKQLKGWLRSKKVALIESKNPKWLDLSVELFDWAKQ